MKNGGVKGRRDSLNAAMSGTYIRNISQSGVMISSNPWRLGKKVALLWIRIRGYDMAVSWGDRLREDVVRKLGGQRPARAAVGLQTRR